MKKYSDWQRYVKEQIDRMGEPAPGAPAQPAPPPRAPEKENFLIRRKDQPEQRHTPAEQQRQNQFPPHPAAKAAAAAQPPQPEKPSAAEQAEQRRQQELFRQAQPETVQPPAEETAKPIASPFVSVKDIWKDAEKSARAPRRQPPQAEAPPPARETAPQKPRTAPAPPKPERPTRHAQPAPPELPQSEALRASRDQSREEIIERLVNPTISLEEAAKIMGVCKTTVRRYTAMGILPHYRTPGNQRRFKLNDIILFLENQKKQ